MACQMGRHSPPARSRFVVFLSWMESRCYRDGIITYVCCLRAERADGMAIDGGSVELAQYLTNEAAWQGGLFDWWSEMHGAQKLGSVSCRLRTHLPVLVREISLNKLNNAVRSLEARYSA